MSPAEHAERALNAYMGSRWDEESDYGIKDPRQIIIELVRDLCHLADEHGYESRWLIHEAMCKFYQERT